MKKILTLLLLLMTATLFTFAQGVYQFPNADMTNWRRTNGNGDDIPTSWHAFDDALAHRNQHFPRLFRRRQ